MPAMSGAWHVGQAGWQVADGNRIPCHIPSFGCPVWERLRPETGMGRSTSRSQPR